MGKCSVSNSGPFGPLYAEAEGDAYPLWTIFLKYVEVNLEFKADEESRNFTKLIPEQVKPMERALPRLWHVGD